MHEQEKTDEQWIEEALADGAKKLPDSVMRVDDCFCGCGEPEKAWTWVRDYLERIDDSKKPDWFKHPDTGAELVAVYLMDHLRLSEHGSSIGGSWTTEDGKEVLAFLKANGVDWKETGYWVDSRGRSHKGDRWEDD